MEYPIIPLNMNSALNENYRRYLILLRNAKQQIKDLELKIKTLEDAGAVEQINIERTDHPTDFSKLNLTEHVFSFIKYSGKTVISSEIRRGLAAQGYFSKSECFNVTLFKTLQRLKKQQKISAEKRSGVWHYWKKLKISTK